MTAAMESGRRGDVKSQWQQLSSTSHLPVCSKHKALCLLPKGNK